MHPDAPGRISPVQRGRGGQITVLVHWPRSCSGDSHTAPKGGAWLLAICGCYEVVFSCCRLLFGRRACRRRMWLVLPDAAPAATEPAPARDAVAADLAPPHPAPTPSGRSAAAADAAASSSVSPFAPAACAAASPVLAWRLVALGGVHEERRGRPLLAAPRFRATLSCEARVGIPRM